MKLIKASYEILSDIDSDKLMWNIELAGRTAYKSEDKITNESADKFISMLINKVHESVLEHEKLTIKFICDRGVSHELVRHRIASFTQESTRYCNYSNDKFGNQLTFIIPVFITEEYSKLINFIEGYKNDGVPTYSTTVWLNAMVEAEQNYIRLIDCGWSPQEARSVLPNSLKTEIIVTANIREWRLIFKQRTANGAHPQMRELMRPLLDSLKVKLPILFNDISY